MRTISLFSGCGGMDFGAKAAGARIVLAIDNDRDSASSLRLNFKSSKIVEADIREFSEFPEAEMVIGGYPCQSFSMGGNRNPGSDPRTYLYREFVRCVNAVHPKYFVAENVSGLKSIQNGAFLREQFAALGQSGKNGYRIYAQVLNARDYGVPQSRKRIFIVGIRADLKQQFIFPSPTHRDPSKGDQSSPLPPWTSHGEAIRDLPLWPKGEFYERPHDPEGHWSWYYMSRNRKADWHSHSFTIVANWRHMPLHPASPVMTLTWSNLADGWKQRWDFSDQYEHIKIDPSLPILKEPRRLSWRECARIQTFPHDFTPAGNTESKIRQLGNAVPPLLAEIIIRAIISGHGLTPIDKKGTPSRQLTLW